MRILTTSVSLVLVSSLTVLGCALKHESTTSNANENVNGGSDSAETESNAEALASSFVSGSGSGTGALSLAGALELQGGGEMKLDALGDAAKAYYQPAGCLTVTNDTANSKATYVFADCTGPYGLVHLTGSVVVGYTSSGPTNLTLSYSASAFKINNATIDWQASAVITANGTARDMVWDGHFSGTTGHGRAFQRTNHKEYRWTVGVPCLSVSGSSDGTVTGHELKIDVIDYSRCKLSCPEAGSEIKITDKTTGNVYDLKYNGDNATYTEPNGQQITFRPLCALL